MITGSYQGFDVEIQVGGIAVITFDKPERLNAMSFGCRRDLCELLELVQLDDSVRVVVITGTGRGFVAGVNNRSVTDEPPTLVPDVPLGNSARVPVNLYSRLSTYAQEPVRSIRRLDKLTIAAVNGAAIQMGLSIVLACDFAIASRSSQLGSATLRMGWQPDEGGHWLLVEHLGVKRALEFLMLRRIVSGAEAADLGLINEVVDDDQLMQRSLELARELAAGPQVAMRLLKKAVYNAARLSYEQAGDDIATKTAVSDFHDDAHDGAAAFFEKRAPVFNQWLDARGNDDSDH